MRVFKERRKKWRSSAEVSTVGSLSQYEVFWNCQARSPNPLSGFLSFQDHCAWRRICNDHICQRLEELSGLLSENEKDDLRMGFGILFLFTLLEPGIVVHAKSYEECVHAWWNVGRSAEIRVHKMLRKIR